MTEQEEFMRNAAAAIHELGRMNARLGLNPDAFDVKAVGQAVYDILNQRDAVLEQLRREIARLKAENASLRPAPVSQPSTLSSQL